MYFSTRILKPVFNGNSRLIALFIVMAKIPLTILPAFLIEVSQITQVAGTGLILSASGQDLCSCTLLWS
jgi:hypothetical protein